MSELAFGNPEWRAILAGAGLDRFESLWGHPAPAIEPPNERRGGSSRVARIEVRGAGGAPVTLYLKRQEGQRSRDFRHPLRGRPTLEREWENLAAFRAIGLTVAAAVAFGSTGRGSNCRSLLVTGAIEAAAPLDRLLAPPSAGGAGIERGQRRRLARDIGRALRRLHEKGYRHGALYPKHLLIDGPGADGSFTINWIDLETCRRTPFGRRARRRDLDAFNRRTLDASRSDRLRFLLAWAGRSRVDEGVRRWWRELVRTAT